MNRAQTLLRYVHKVAAETDAERVSDRDLLRRFAEARDQAAFTTLVQRHGPMVLRVCRRRLQNWHDAEDVCQATFLVLASKAASPFWHVSVASWLHRVAYYLSLKATTAAARRAEFRRESTDRAAPSPLEAMTGRELSEVLDEELARLPEKYRAPLVLCYLEGATRDEAARQLGCPVPTLKSRVDRGRELLHMRLTRRGLTLSAALSAAGLVHASASAAPLAAPWECLARGALSFITDKSMTAGTISARALGLAQTALASMSLTRLKIVAALFTGLCVLVGGVGAIVHSAMPVTEQIATGQPAKTPPSRDVSDHGKAPVNSPRLDRSGDPLPEDAIARLGTTRLRHGGMTTALAFAPDGKSLFTMGADGLRTWDVATGNALSRITSQVDRDLNPGILSADGKHVITVNPNRQTDVLRLWEVDTSRLLLQFGDHPCLAGCFSPDGKMLATMGTTQPGHARYRPFINVISLWDLASGRRMNSWSGHQDGVYCGLFTDDGKILITGGADKIIRFWDVTSGQEVRQLQGSPAPLGHLVFSPDRKLMAAIARAWPGPPNNYVGIWDMVKGEEIQHFSLPRSGQQGFTAAIFSPDGKTLITAGPDQFARLWDIATGKEVRRRDFGGSLWALALSPDGKTLAGMSDGKTVRLLDVDTGRDLLARIGHEFSVFWAGVTPDKTTAITGSHGQSSIIFWDMKSGQQQPWLTVLPTVPTGLCISGDGTVLYCCENDNGTIVVLDLRTRKLLRRLLIPAALKYPPGRNWARMALSLDGKTLALATDHGDTVALIDVMTGKESNLLRSTGQGISQLAFAPDNRMLVVFCQDPMIELWDSVQGTKLRQMVLPGTIPLGRNVRLVGLDAMALSPNGKLIAYVSRDFSPAVAELASGQRLGSAAVSGIERGISVFAFSPDSRMLAWSGWSDHAIHLLEVATGGERHRFAGHPGPVHCLQFSADGRMLISASEDTTALIWDVAGPLGDRKTAAETLSPETLKACWRDLATGDSANAYRVIRRLAAGPAEAIPYLRARLSSVPAVADERLARLIADLDNATFATRAQAAKELEQLGELAMNHMQKAAAGNASLEVKRQLETLLGKQTQERLNPSPEILRILRTLEVLELAGTPEARQTLERLASGASQARLTQDAKASLDRLARPKKP